MAMKNVILSIVSLLVACSSANAIDVETCGDLFVSGATYILKNDVVSDGTCFTISANNITLDLNGKNIIYDNAIPLKVNNGDFESELSGSWDVANAPNSYISLGTYLDASLYSGNYALNIATPASDQMVKSIKTIILQPNTTYSLSGMVYNKVSDDIMMKIGLEGTEIYAVQSGRTWRGFQYIYSQFTTGANQESYKIILSISGASDVSAGKVYFDDIRVQQSAHYGIDSGVGDTKWARSPIIKNGTITQGQAHGDWSHAVKLTRLYPDDIPNYEISNLTINISGNSCKAILADTISNSSIHDNIINSNVDTIASRDHYDGSLIHIKYKSYSGKIYNNIIKSGIQTGIYSNSIGDVNRVEVFGNNITLQSKYTNDFAIVCYSGYGNNIYNNTINCGDGDNSCRGIYLNSVGGSIHDNNIYVHYKKNNQEYGGCAGSSYGIQLEAESSNVEVYKNNVTAYADECNSAAFRYYGPNIDKDLNNNIHDNIFKAVAIGDSSIIAASMQILQSYSGHINFNENVLETNSCWLYIDGLISNDDNRGLSVEGNRFVIKYPINKQFYPLIDVAFINGENYPRNVSIINNIYNDSVVRSYLSSAKFVSRYLGFKIDPYAWNVVVAEKMTDNADIPVITNLNYILNP